MLINLLIASAFIFITLMVIVNFNRILEFAEMAVKRFRQFKLIINTLIRAYRQFSA